MSNAMRDEINRLHAQVCSGLADTNRILILYSLSERPHNVSELAQELKIAQPSVSRHLKILRERNMVAADRKGQSVIYRLTDKRIIEALDILRAFLADQLESQVELARSASDLVGHS